MDTAGSVEGGLGGQGPRARNPSLLQMPCVGANPPFRDPQVPPYPKPFNPKTPKPLNPRAKTLNP